jgi:hypothetical protein
MKKAEGGRRLHRAKRDSVNPYTLRVRRDHGGGLWTFESQDGQLYLAVKSREFQPVEPDPAWASRPEWEEELRTSRNVTQRA